MCLWLLTTCLGLLPATPSSPPATVIVVPPPPIVIPTLQPTYYPPPPPPPPFPPGNETPNIVDNTPPNTEPPPTNPTNIIPPGAVLVPIVVCQTPSAVCVANPNQPSAPGTVSPPIDPRLGTTPGASAALQQFPQITAYSGQLPSYDTAVKFPRLRRSLKKSDGDGESKHVIRKRQSCVCVPAGTCPPGGSGNLGIGLIDIRIVTPVNDNFQFIFC